MLSAQTAAAMDAELRSKIAEFNRQQKKLKLAASKLCFTCDRRKHGSPLETCSEAGCGKSYHVECLKLSQPLPGDPLFVTSTHRIATCLLVRTSVRWSVGHELVDVLNV